MLLITNRKALGILTAAGVVLLDQLSKAVVVQHMALHESFPVIAGFFNITYVRNTGAAFGILSGQAPWLRSVLLVGSSILAVGFILWIWVKEGNSSWSRAVSLGMILGGALGNMLDRVRLGEVIDFLDFYWGKYHWPAFNVADSAVTVGILMFLPSFLMFQKGKPASK